MLQIGTTPVYIDDFKDEYERYDRRATPSDESKNHVHLRRAFDCTKALLSGVDGFESVAAVRTAWNDACKPMDWCSDAETATHLFQRSFYAAYSSDMFTVEHVVGLDEFIFKVSVLGPQMTYALEEVAAWRSAEFKDAVAACEGTGIQMGRLFQWHIFKSVPEYEDFCKMLGVGARVEDDETIDDFQRVVRVMALERGENLIDLKRRNARVTLVQANRMMALVRRILAVFVQTGFLHVDLNHGNILFDFNVDAAEGADALPRRKRRRLETLLHDNESVTATVIDFGHVGFLNHPHTGGIELARINDYSTYAATVVAGYSAAIMLMLSVPDADAFAQHTHK